MTQLPIQASGPLFEAVQKNRIFPDSKTFVDAIPKAPPHEIEKAYTTWDKNDLKGFISQYFTLPKEENLIHANAETPLEYIEAMWDGLQKEMEADSEFDTLISLPYPHIIPGGRFRESYYWDSYFEAIGLHVQDKQDIIDALIENFCFLIDRFGYVPNGNRVYYLSRSQAPFFSHLITLSDTQKYLPFLEKEYRFWMQEGAHFIPNGLNRYYDTKETPREESFYEDYMLIKKEKDPFYRHIRAICESGWDFSSRWLQDETSLRTACTCDLYPVDLNALLYHMETSLGLEKASIQRKNRVDELLWNEEKGFYFDYNFSEKKRMGVWSLAACYPLFVGMASQNQADKVAEHLREKFLRSGGLLTTLTKSGQQWDAPDGWAPLQWIAFKGLKNYGHDTLADEIGARFLETCRLHFTINGTFLEKYNMENPESLPQNGEYTLQTGFGWTNGVYAALSAEMSE